MLAFVTVVLVVDVDVLAAVTDVVLVVVGVVEALALAFMLFVVVSWLRG